MSKSYWTINPEKFADWAAEDHKKLCIKIALDIHRKLTLRTPVDTGRARSNWIPTINQPATHTVEPTGPWTAAQAAYSVFTEEMVPDFPLLYITNNVDYIGALNDGHSKQQPANFVELAIAEVVRVL